MSVEQMILFIIFFWIERRAKEFKKNMDKNLCSRESAKKVPPLVVRPLSKKKEEKKFLWLLSSRGGGDWEALVVETFFYLQSFNINFQEQIRDRDLLIMYLHKIA